MDKKEMKFLIIAGVVLVSIFGTFLLLINLGNGSGEKYSAYPPITMQGHREDSPPSHVLKQPMPLPTQKHMLEHADGTGQPGVIINYNCKDFTCESGLITNLEKFAAKYNHVYVAPFPKMQSKIVLTKLGLLKKLDKLDEEQIINFIEGKRDKGDLIVFPKKNDE